MAICPKLWGKQEQELIPLPVAEHPSCGSSEIALGKSKGGKKALLLGRRSSKKPWATVSVLVPSGGAPHALQGRTEFSAASGSCAAAAGRARRCRAVQPRRQRQTSERLRPRHTTHLRPSPARGLISASFGRAAPSPVNLPPEALRFPVVHPGS